MTPDGQKPVRLVPVPLPPPEQQVRRGADFAPAGTEKGRYHLPASLSSASVVGYRTRVPLSAEEADAAAILLSLPRPATFVPGPALTEGALFEEASLGVLSARQSTNYRGYRQVSVGPDESRRVAELLGRLHHRESEPVANAACTHLVLDRPYRTPFTFLLTFIGHKPFSSLWTVPQRAWRKRFDHQDDIPTIGFLPQLHVGILADAMERAAVIASGGRRAAAVFSAPFAGRERQAENRAVIAEIEAMAGLSDADRAAGWRVALVTQVGYLPEPLSLSDTLCRKLGALFLAFRSERIQPGVNQEDRAPEPYAQRQDMDVPPELVEMAGRAAYNAFFHWTGLDREQAKQLLLMERIDVLSPNGKERLREVRRQLEDVTDRVVADLPLWADLPTGKALSRNAARGRKAFALAGQRIYVGGLSRSEVAKAGIGWEHALRAFGAAASRSALVAELSGCIGLPASCDLLAGTCLMAGPVNQNDIGKQFYGGADLLAGAYPGRDPTALLVWTLKAKTVADPIGNEEQLMDARRKGALVDLRPGPHEVVSVLHAGKILPLRAQGGQTNEERAFADVGNFVTAPDGRGIPNNAGTPWPGREAPAFGP